jgi:hypothetical protein
MSDLLRLLSNPLVMIGIFVLLAIVATLLASAAAKRRTEALGRVAETLGFNLTTQASVGSVPGFTALPLASRGKSQAVHNLLTGRIDGHDLRVFDFKYVTGSGKHRQTHRQSVVGVTLPAARLPPFTLQPESIWNKIGALFGSRDINFENHPEFSRRYHLRADMEEAVRAVFQDPVLHHFETMDGVSLEANGNTFILYRQDRVLEPERLGDALHEAVGVARTLAVYARAGQA